MAIGFTTSATYGSRQIRPDRSLSRASAPKVLVAKFGDGYEQRVADGINSIEENFSISFVNRTKEEIDDITGYFSSLAGATSFNYTISDSNVSPSGETTIKVICDQWDTVYVNVDVYSCNATFRRVYEA